MQSEHSLNKEYLNNEAFKQIEELAEFYDNLSFSTLYWVPMGTKAILNIDTYVFSSIKGTLESINDLLRKGRLNDSYALLRKYYDAVIINLYTNLYLEEEFDVINNFIVDSIQNWITGKEEIPSFRKMSEYIEKCTRVQNITKLLYGNNSFKGSIYEGIRKRCNSNVHYLHYSNVLLNDNQIYLKNREQELNKFKYDLLQISILHFSYLFYFKDHYMMSSDYHDSMDLGLKPEKDSEYMVAPFIQIFFEAIIMKHRPDIGNEIKTNTEMRLV